MNAWQPRAAQRRGGAEGRHKHVQCDVYCRPVKEEVAWGPLPTPRCYHCIVAPCVYAQVLYKTGKAFVTRGLDKCAENCELLRGEVEQFKKFVPLVQVRGEVGGRQWAGRRRA